MSNLNKRTGNAEVGQPSTDVAERKAAARALRPVRNDPQAATHPSDFVQQSILEVDADGNDIIPEPKVAAPVEGVEGKIAQKNADADKKRQAAATAKLENQVAELEEQLKGTVRRAEEVIDEKTSVMEAQAKEIEELEHKLSTIEGIADDDDDEGNDDNDNDVDNDVVDEETGKDLAPTAAEVAAQKRKDATAKAKASAKGKKK